MVNLLNPWAVVGAFLRAGNVYQVLTVDHASDVDQWGNADQNLKFFGGWTAKTVGDGLTKKLRRYYSGTMKSMIGLAIKMSQGLSAMYGTHVVINSKKFYDGDNRPVTMYSVRDSYRTRGGEWQDKELFRATSLVQVVLYLRDLLCVMRGEELPVVDDEKYAKARAAKDVAGSTDWMRRNYVG